ncbi:MAG TPA: zf-HC2 domain-containing protein [Aggregatilineales bacterium]|nr:zf-HC2 domain-containing protein [Aggregatilineales bacterium]
MGEHTHHHGPESCRGLLGHLSLYLDGEAEEAICREIEQHMAGCENCRVVIDTLAGTVRLYKEHGHSRLSGEARSRLYAALDLSDYLTAEGADKG